MQSGAIKHVLGWMILIMIVCGCAKITDISGGDKDSRGPRIEKAEPDTFSLQFKAKEIVLKFDEYVNVKNPSQEIFYSPPMKNAPDVIGVGKKVTIKLKDTLLAQTTYTINFGSSIEDITEGNKALGLSYVFSTGSYIDSLSLQGRVDDAFSLKGQKNVKVMLYESFEDSLPLKVKPLYYCFTDESGQFHLKYLKNTSYKIFALEEENGNFIYDRPGEKIAFLTELIQPIDSLRIELKLFKEDNQNALISKAKSVARGKLLFEFEGDGRAVKLTPSQFEKEFADSLFQYNRSGDSLYVWYKPIDADSMIFYAEKSSLVFDTLVIKIPKNHQASANPSQGNRGKSKEPRLTVMTNTQPGKPFDIYSRLTLNFKKPIESIDTSKIRFVSKTKDEIPLMVEFKPATKANMEFQLDYEWKEETTYQIIFRQGAFVSVDSESSDSSGVEFKTRAKSDYCSISIQLKNQPDSKAYILDLLNSKDEVIKTKGILQEELGKITFDHLEAGDYKFRLITDNNANQKWDSGNYAKKIQPENVYYMTETITLKQSWDVANTWDFAKQSAKLRK